MARALIVGVVLLSFGCASGSAISPERSVATWREMQASGATRATAHSAAGAAEAAQNGEALTAEQAFALALANNPELAVWASQVEVAEHEIGAARQIDNPTVRLTNFRVDDGVKGGSGPGLNLGVRAPIPRPGSVRARVHGARLGAENAQRQVEAARRRLHAELLHHFARLALLTADLEEVSRALELCDERRRQVGARVEQAVATDVELALAEVAHAEALDEARRLRGELARTEAELARLVGPGPLLRFRVDLAALDAGDLELDPDALTEQALRGRPELRAVQTRVGQAEAEASLARGEVMPWLSWAQVNYYVGPGETPRSALGFAVALEVPLFSVNRGKIRAARALVRQRQVEERAEVAAVASEVEVALARTKRAYARVEEIEEGLLPQVDAAAQEADAALAAGTLDVMQVLDIEARRVAARRLHLSARFERREALIELEAAIGAPLGR